MNLGSGMVVRRQKFFLGPKQLNPINARASPVSVATSYIHPNLIFLPPIFLPLIFLPFMFLPLMPPPFMFLPFMFLPWTLFFIDLSAIQGSVQKHGLPQIRVASMQQGG